MNEKKKQLSKEVLHAIERFESLYGEYFDLEKAISCNRGISIEALKGWKLSYDNFESDNDQFTFAILKPNAVKSGQVNGIIEDIQAAGFEIVAAQKIIFSKGMASEFYTEHRGKPFFDELVNFLSSGPSYTLILEKEGGSAVEAFRELMGPVAAVNEPDDYPDTLRARYANSMTENSVHGSDSYNSFLKESNLVFFKKNL